MSLWPASSYDSLVSVHRPNTSTDRRIAVLYLHGGGLTCCDRNDLPEPYVQQFLDAGYTLVCIDYPMAPESSLPEIVDTIFATWHATVCSAVVRGKLNAYALFGRSAGAYLAFMLAREIHRRNNTDTRATFLPQPMGIIDFYGYFNLEDSALRLPAKAYTILPEVTKDQVERIVSSAGEDVRPTAGPVATRFALYVYARQHENAWLELMGLDNTTPERTAAAWSLSLNDISLLPPIFIAASTDDADVPFRISKTLARAARQSKMKTVYFLPHAFDSDLSNPIGKQVYAEALAWLNALHTV